MQDEFYRNIYKPDAFTQVTVKEMLADPELAPIYKNGFDSYTVGKDYRNCPHIRDTMEEHVWQRGWENSAIGDVESIASFDKEL